MVETLKATSNVVSQENAEGFERPKTFKNYEVSDRAETLN